MTGERETRQRAERCPYSGTTPPRSFDGHCPKCGARVGANRNDRIKVHDIGKNTRVITTGKMADY